MIDIRTMYIGSTEYLHFSLLLVKQCSSHLFKKTVKNRNWCDKKRGMQARWRTKMSSHLYFIKSHWV